MITLIIAAIIVILLFYYLIIRGNIWPLLMVAFCVYGGRLIILSAFPLTHKTILNFASYNISYATFIAVIIAILGVGIIMEKN